MTKAFSNEWASKGIQVNCICPGYVVFAILTMGLNLTFVSHRYFKTPLTQQLVENPEFDNYVLTRTPAGRWGQPDDLRGAIIFLSSPASNYVSGTSIIVDGGMLGN